MAMDISSETLSGQNILRHLTKLVRATNVRIQLKNSFVLARQMSILKEPVKP